METPRVFVVGVGRSGTTLVQSMLAAHPKIEFLPETVFIRRYVATGFLEKIYCKDGVDQVRKTLLSDQHLKRLDVSVNKALDNAQKNNNVKNFDVCVYNSFVRQIVGSGKAAFIGDKDPRLVEYIPLLASIFPKCKIIHVIRDPRDILESKKRAEWSKKRFSITHVFAGKAQFKLGRKNGLNLNQNEYLEVYYEKLIHNPEKELKNICQWLGIDYDSEMLDFAKAAKKLVAKDEMSWKKETLGPLLTTNIGKWKNGLTNWEVKLSEVSCKESMLAGRYVSERKMKDLSFGKRIWFLAAAIVIEIACRPYMFYRNYKVLKACKKIK